MAEADPRKPTQGELKNEIASIERDITQLLVYGGGAKILFNGDETLRTRGGGKGVKLFTEIERDCHAGSVLDKRKRAVTAREWAVDPASEDARDVEVAEFVKQVLEDLRFDQVTKDLLDATNIGYSVVEIMWQARDGFLVPARHIARAPERFVFDVHGKLRLLTREKPVEGEEMPDRKFIVHTYNGKDGIPYGRGLGSRLFWPVFFKRQGMTFWLIFCDKFGGPTALGKYPTGSSPDDQEKLLEALKAISQEAAVIIPAGMEAELLEAARTGGAEGYERLVVYLDSEMSKCVLGETLTTTVGNSGGNRALGDVHNEVRMELAKDDADALSYTLNETLVKWITEYNFPGRTPPTVWRNFDQAEDLDKLADRDKKLGEIGFVPTADRVHDVYGEGYEKKVAVAPPAAPGAIVPVPEEDRPEFAERAGWLKRFARWLGFAEGDDVDAARQANRDDQAALVEGAEQVAQGWERLMRKRVDDIRAILDETGDLALFRERLDELLESEPPKEIVEALQKSGFAAHLLGRTPRNKL